MNKMIARTALVATLAVSAMSLSACGESNDCAHAASANNTITATTAMLPTRGGGHGGGGHASGHGEGGAHGETSTGAHSETESNGGSSNGGGFVWPRWIVGGHSNQCQKPEPATKS